MNLITLIISIVLLIGFIFFYRKRNTISPIVIFFLLWTFVLFLSNLNLYGIYRPSFKAYFLIMLMLLFFSVGIILNIIITKQKAKKSSSFKSYKSNRKIVLRYKLYYFLCFCLIFFNIIDIIIIIKELANGNPMWQIRNWTLEPVGSSNPILERRSFLESAFRNIILASFQTIIPPITAYYFFYEDNRKRKYSLFVVSLIVLITSSIAGGGGRLGFIYYIGCFILTFFIAYKKSSIEVIQKYKKILCIFIILAVLFVVIYTIVRTGLGNIGKQIYTYFALPPTLLSIWLPDMENVKHTFDLTTFHDIHRYFFRVLETIGLDFLVPQIYNDTYTYILNAETFKQVGYGIANAFVTPIYYFYIDGGYPFVCIVSVFFGYIVSALYEKFDKRIDARSFVIYGLVMYGVFVSFIRIQTAIPSYIISFAFAIFLLKKQKVNKGIDDNKKKKEDFVNG